MFHNLFVVLKMFQKRARIVYPFHWIYLLWFTAVYIKFMTEKFFQNKKNSHHLFMQWNNNQQKHRMCHCRKWNFEKKKKTHTLLWRLKYFNKDLAKANQKRVHRHFSFCFDAVNAVCVQKCVFVCGCVESVSKFIRNSLAPCRACGNPTLRVTSHSKHYGE